MILEIHRPAKTDPASRHGSVRLGNEGSGSLADLFEHPFSAAGPRGITLRNHQWAPLKIEETGAETGAADVNG